MPESLAVRRAEMSNAITRVHEVLEAFAARYLNRHLDMPLGAFRGKLRPTVDALIYTLEKRHMLLTNPDQLDIRVLPNDTRCTRNCENLLYFVLGVLHSNPGAFGNHLCSVLRR